MVSLTAVAVVSLALTGSPSGDLVDQPRPERAELPAGDVVEETVPDRTESSLCFMGRRGPECHLFVLTEIDVSRRAMANRPRVLFPGMPFDWTYAWKLGVMVNVGTRSAVGAALVRAYMDETVGSSRTGVEGRYRYWMARRLSLDVGAGFLPGVPGDAYDLSVALNLADMVALSAHLQTIRLPHGWDLGVYPGVRLGSWASLYAMAIVPVVLMVLVAGAAGG